MTKEEIKQEILAEKFKIPPHEEYNPIHEAMEEYASRQPFQQLISWMEEEKANWHGSVSKNLLYTVISKAKELAAAPPDTHCTCKEPLGNTSVACCNDCGLPVEKWWNGAADGISQSAAPPDESGVKDDWVSVANGLLPDFDEQVIFRAKIDWKKGDDSVVYFVDKLTRQEETLEYGHWAYLLAGHTDFLVSQNPLIKEVCQEYVTHWKPLKPLPAPPKEAEKIGEEIQKVVGIVLCPDCFGDGIETCHNPDHGFLSGVLGSVYGANESACPCCGHSSDHKMKGKCWTCKGTGQVSKEDYDKYLDEFVDKDDEDVINKHCLKNYA